MFSLFLVQVIQAEIKVATLLAENNFPFAFADKLNKIFSIIFPDSNIAKEHRMAKTKTTCILNKSLAPYFLQETVSIMKNEHYSLSADGSNDSDLEQMNPLTVRLFDVNTKKVETRFLNLCCTTGQFSRTPETIFSKIESIIDYLEVPWENCVGFSLGNASANMGIRNSIKSRIIAKNEVCCIMGCSSHIIHNTAHQGSTAFTSVTPFETEDFCVFYYFDKSTKRKCSLKTYYEFCDQEYRQILKHINVRWLGLEKAVERI